MNVAGSPQQIAEKTAPVQIGKSEQAPNSKGFSNLLSNAIAKSDVKPNAVGIAPEAILNKLAATPETAGTHPALAAPSKAEPKSAVDLSFLGEVLDKDKKVQPAKLADLLADVSHESQAPEGTSIINLKTILGSKNDDPTLLNTNLIALVPPEEQKAVVQGLIKGAKKFLKDKLNAHIPIDRVPNTLKGMLETAIKFDIDIKDVKLENIPSSKATDKLASLFVQSQNPMIATPKHKVNLGTQIIDPMALAKAVVSEKETSSPLTKLLEKATSDSKAPSAIAKAAPILPSVAKESEKDKIKAKDKDELIKTELAKSSPQNELKPAVLATATEQKKTNSPLAQLLSQDENSATEAVTKEAKAHESTLAKTDTAVKADHSIESKNIEGRQLISRLSADVKEAMEQYKPPFTKLTMKLNPERLGEIDVTMVQRGSNVHINLSSNNAALGMLQQQSSELKAALADAGLGDASMNFSQSEDSQTRQQAQRQHMTQEKYAEMAQLEEEYDALEIIVPRYV